MEPCFQLIYFCEVPRAIIYITNDKSAAMLRLVTNRDIGVWANMPFACSNHAILAKRQLPLPSLLYSVNSLSRKEPAIALPKEFFLVGREVLQKFIGQG
jgi:hypothetical protein